MQKAKAYVSIGLFGLLGSGCFGDEDTSERVESATAVNDPADIASASSSDYDENQHGLVTPRTLAEWSDDWESARQELDAVDNESGRLVILQVNGPPYVAHDREQGVVTYRLDTDRITEVRSNGVMTNVSMVPSGSQMDAFLEAYGIDPEGDLVVWAMGEGGAFPAMQQGRGWYMMRYWGVPAQNLALLNGGVQENSVEEGEQIEVASEPICNEAEEGQECLPDRKRASVADLPEDNFALQATVEDVIDIADGSREAFLWDARSEAEYTAAEVEGAIDFRNNAAKQGHPNNAVHLNYTALVNEEDWSYRDKEALSALFERDADNGAGFTSYDGQGQTTPVSSDEAYRDGETVVTYCETTFRAMITGFASAAILGKPTQFYDGAMREWNSLAHSRDEHGIYILPSDSPWRTDLATLSHFRYQPSMSQVEPRPIDDPYAESSDAIISEDRGYALGDEGTEEGDEEGVAPPAQPCG